ncbi:MAG: phosphatidate cytidylyltransferase [Pseudomonadota bacterium]
MLASNIFNHELKLRIFSAVLLASIVLTMTWIGGDTFVLLWAVAAFLVFREYSRICASVIQIPHKMAAFIAIALVLAAWLFTDPEVSKLMAVISFVVLLIWELITKSAVWTALGFAYSVLPFVAMSEMRGDDYAGLILILIIFACVWGADVLAFFFGKIIGGPKLAPSISPKKTWSGFIGSLIGAVLLASIVEYYAGYKISTIFIACVLYIAFLSQVGDLIESSLKRRFKVKDSGSLIPGHGGVLDRIDGLILSAIGTWLLLTIIRLVEDNNQSLGQIFTDVILLP